MHIPDRCQRRRRALLQLTCPFRPDGEGRRPIDDWEQLFTLAGETIRVDPDEGERREGGGEESGKKGKQRKGDGVKNAKYRKRLEKRDRTAAQRPRRILRSRRSPSLRRDSRSRVAATNQRRERRVLPNMGSAQPPLQEGWAGHTQPSGGGVLKLAAC